MKLLFDENVSHTLVGILAPEFPDSAHVSDRGLRAAETAGFGITPVRTIS